MAGLFEYLAESDRKAPLRYRLPNESGEVDPRLPKVGEAVGRPRAR
jgi:hypothetical protein